MRSMRCFLVAAMLAFQALLSAETAQELKIPMSDGVQLCASVFTPSEGQAPFPVVLERTPYPRATKGTDWTGMGMVFVDQSVRGQFGSEGAFRPFADEGWGEHQDGADTFQWLLKQPWCNGKIATVGGSAPGLTQVLLAPMAPALSCQVIEVACGDFERFSAYQGGVFGKALCEDWLKAVGVPDHANVWKAQRPGSPYWRTYNADARAADIHAPGMHVGGWWDIFASGTVEHFLARQLKGGEGARGNQKLVMRPAAHGGWGAQDLKFPKNYDEFRVTPYRKRFMQHWLLGKDTGIMKEPAVNYYTVGDDTHFEGPGWKWRTADTWPPFNLTPTSYYLHADGVLSTSAPSEEDAARAYDYDPKNPVPTLGGENLTIAYGPYDQRPVSTRPDVLSFSTPPLTAPLEATGNFAVELYISSDAPDTDFTAKLVDIYPPPDGREILMLDSIQRVKYREGRDHAAPPLKPGEMVRVKIDLGPISWIFNTNHRIGLQISSSNLPRFELNPNNGEEFPGETPAPRVAHNTVHMAKARPSALLLPVREKK